MTWRDLKDFISKQTKKNRSFLNEELLLYDFQGGDEYQVNLTELIPNTDSEESGWKVYLSINDKEVENETETKETSID